MLNEVNVAMEIGTGAVPSIVSKSTYEQFWPKDAPYATQVRLKSYNSIEIAVEGAVSVEVKYTNSPTATNCGKWPWS